MIEIFKDRELKAGQKVSVHLNLHKKNFAITALEGEYKGRVVAYSNTLLLEGVTFKIRRSVQERVKRNKVKEVHAWVIGTFTGEEAEGKENLKEAYYNPRTVDDFVDKKSLKKLEKAEKMMFSDRQMFYI